MSGLSSSLVSGMKIVIIEDTIVGAVTLSALASWHGGKVVACVPTVAQALGAAKAHRAERIVLGKQFTEWPRRPLERHFGNIGAELIYVDGNEYSAGSAMA